MVPQLNFLTRGEALDLAAAFGTPTFVYDETLLRQQAAEALAFPNPFGLTTRYALKANPTASILELFDSGGLHFDASSGFEAWRALRAHVAPEKISLSAQELPCDLEDLVERGVRFVATSLHQIETYGTYFPGTKLAVRFNPGKGSGATHKTNVGGRQASFGIWHAQSERVRETLQAHRLTIDRIHTHIGSGTDPIVWQRAAELSLGLVRNFDSVTTLDLGGGFKVGRMPGETSTDLQVVGAPVAEALERFAEKTNRKIHLEIEPGTYLVAEAGVILSTVQDIVSTQDDQQKRPRGRPRLRVLKNRYRHDRDPPSHFIRRPAPDARRTP